MKRILLALFVLLAPVSNGWAEDPHCQPIMDHGEPSGYRVISYDGTSKTWTILRNGTFDGKYMVKRIIVACNAHRYSNGNTLEGPGFCNLNVGRLYRWHKHCDNGETEMVMEFGSSSLSITEGEGSQEDVQFFNIVKYEILPDTH